MVRITAWHLLRNSETPLRDVDRAAKDAELDDRDRGLLRKIIAIEVRRRGTLRSIVRTYATGKPSTDLSAHIHIGLVQLLFLDQVPDHAAVSETVGAVRDTMGPSKVRYVNAILRTVARERVEGLSGDPKRDLVGRDIHLNQEIFRDPEAHPLLFAEDALSIPAPLFKRWLKRHGEAKARELAMLAMEESPLSVRTTTGEMELVQAEFEELSIDRFPGKHPDVLLFDSMSTPAVLHSRAFTEGRITVQGECALRAAELLEAKEGERILDLCAAPGGKTAVLVKAGYRVTSLDNNNQRLERLRGNLARLQYAADVVEADAATYAPDELYDGILLDAPCSATGTFRRHPEVLWHRGAERIGNRVALQRVLIANAAACLKPGGVLVYCVCSLEPGEGIDQLAWVAQTHPELELDPVAASELPDLTPAIVSGCVRTHPALPVPGDKPGTLDGFFVARFRRR